LYLNYDLDADRPFFQTQNDLLTKIRLEIGNEGFVFLDEIQRKEDAGLFLKGLYDLDTAYKFVVSGSGSLELKEKIAESLAGRKRIFTLYPLDFNEFLNFRTDYHYEGKLGDFLQIEREKGQNLLAEYLSFGGYPKVVLAATLEEKTAAMADIFESYLEKDISTILHLKKAENFTHLVRLLAAQMGQLLNYSNLASTLGLSEKTVKHYLWYLSKTFIGERVSPFTRRAAKEIVKSPVFYFVDMGLANYATKDFYLHDLSTLGFHFQNMIYRQIKSADTHYWRTKDRAEVDFVVDSNKELIPIEVKLQSFTSPKVTGGITSFIKKYHPQKAYFVNLDLAERTTYNNTKVYFVPYYLFAKEILAFV
jgi:predicted AAA+ superfamily ATPase